MYMYIALSVMSTKQSHVEQIHYASHVGIVDGSGSSSTAVRCLPASSGSREYPRVCLERCLRFRYFSAAPFEGRVTGSPLMTLADFDSVLADSSRGRKILTI